ncbi:hypothetical protein [Rathayibacter sp. VKM Ac-2926]|uniref:hypothetical protein n=1 Tax=Rathayibacter sp. VKM Ac-2926 TaxID=2929477 RepID=UPI001FB29C4E|nr:hypothetical protein [Rathayibacter sp. VKM Ac-2926]MCJ1702704.1 hypothetical protein [Rathayibacter sp. VKM Ac-2926]
MIAVMQVRRAWDGELTKQAQQVEIYVETLQKLEASERATNVCLSRRVGPAVHKLQSLIDVLKVWRAADVLDVVAPLVVGDEASEHMGHCAVAHLESTDLVAVGVLNLAEGTVRLVAADLAELPGACRNREKNPVPLGFTSNAPDVRAEDAWRKGIGPHTRVTGWSIEHEGRQEKLVQS